MKTHFVALLVGAALAAPAQAKTIYVNASSNPATQDGASWSTAFVSVQGGVDAAVSGDEIWVATSAPASDGGEIIHLKGGVSLYGGFAGTETARSQRDWTTNGTELNGAELDETAPGEGAVLDGFTLTGKAVDPGVMLNGGSVTVSNCYIDKHVDVYVAGTGTANVCNCTFTSRGYGIRLLNAAKANVYNCTISGVRFTWMGGGPGVSVEGGSATVTNCTISGMHDGVYVGQPGSATVINCIVAVNTTGINNASLGGAVTVSHSDVYGNMSDNYAGMVDPTGSNGNLSRDPLIRRLDISLGNDYHLLVGSPCIDAGDDTAALPGETDLDGKPRIIGAHVDIGAYEASSFEPYTISDVSQALSVWAGLNSGSLDDLARLKVEPGNPGIVLRDATRIVRKVAGLDVNP